jgi:DSF synthase
MDVLQWSQPYTREAAHTWRQSTRRGIHAVDQPRENDPFWLREAATLKDLELAYDQDKRILWQFMTPRERPSFTPDLLRDMQKTLDMVEDAFSPTADSGDPAVRYLVLASKMPGVYNLGGDLPLFMKLIDDKDTSELRRYAHACIDVQYRRAVNLDLPLCTIALVQGDALGGGFEAALANDIIIAEKSTKFGLPEILFNLFPGMGAYSFLSRRLDATRAEQLMLSGRLYSADEMRDMGIVDVVCEDGKGSEAVEAFVTEHGKAYKGRQAIVQARQIVNPITLDELMKVTDLWVDTAVTLEASDLRRMRHLATAQNRRWAKMRRAA